MREFSTYIYMLSVIRNGINGIIVTLKDDTDHATYDGGLHQGLAVKLSHSIL